MIKVQKEQNILMEKNITFRVPLLGGLTDFCHESGMSIINNPEHLVELIVLLAKCQEEGLHLFPRVYLIEDVGLIKRLLPGSEFLRISSRENKPIIDTLQAAIKTCAPLANMDWSIYLHASSATCIEFGIFRGCVTPFAVVADDIIMGESPSRVIKLHKIATDCVEVQSNNGHINYILLNHGKEENIPKLRDFSNLIFSMTKDINQYKQETTNYLWRTLDDSLKKCHGCLIVVTESRTVPRFLKDGISLEQSLDFNKLITKAKADVREFLTLNSTGSLVGGLLNTDGITVFDTRGRVLGYNCFVKSSRSSSGIGGARRRAFNTICERIERTHSSKITSVFMQSQDNFTLYKGLEQ
jgi:hypothetical protein